MSHWQPVCYINEGRKKGISDDILNNAQAIGEKINTKMPVIFSLNHLAFLTDIEYRTLRAFVRRKRKPYRVFRIHKRSGGFRIEAKGHSPGFNVGTRDVYFNHIHV